jgi:WhiB family redox-sensing transcriptional regulator
MNAVAGDRNARLLAHRVTAHSMDRRGASLEAIAAHLRVSKRSVSRYLAAPLPEQPVTKAAVDLDSFYLDGACGSFPEYDWLSRSPLMQQQCKAICEHCPVLATCRKYGLTTGLEDVGVWGGLTRRERLAELRRRTQASAGKSRRVRVIANSESQGAA